VFIPTQVGRRRVVVVHSVTHLDAAAMGCVIVCGSHGGKYAGAFAARMKVAAAVFNDAAFGLRNAGVRGVERQRRGA
jgi:hypothetical protein